MQASRIALLRGVRFETVGITQIAVSAGTLTGEYVDRVAGVATGTEQLRVYVVRGGEATAIGPSHDGQLLQSGHALIGLTSGAELRIDAGCELLVIDAPRELVTQALKGEVPSTLMIERDSQLLRPTVAFAAQLLLDRQLDSTGLSRYYVERLLQEMLLGILVSAEQLTRMPMAANPYLQAKTVIETRLSDQDLTTDDIAHEVKLSRRQLERLFQRNDTTIAGEVRRARVEAAAEMLQDQSYAALCVDQIAKYVGFSAGSSLARAMAAEGYPPPSSLRRVAA